MLFAAFAAESYVNEFLAAVMADRRARLRTIDRWPTVKKYLEGTHEAYGAPLFFDDREGMPEIRQLFDLRNKLAHPEPGFGMSSIFEADDEAEDEFAPPRLAEFVVMVGGAGELLVRRAYGFDALDVVASAVWLGRDVIRSYAQRASASPVPERRSEPPLLHQAISHVSGMPRLSADADLAISRLRAARKERSEKG